MIALLDEKRTKLHALCVRYRVRRLELFGSAARGEFDSAHSDLDFLVEFQPLEDGQHFRTFFELRRDLERLFGCPVDLVMPSAIENPYFRQRIERERTLLYAAAHARASPCTP